MEYSTVHCAIRHFRFVTLLRLLHLCCTNQISVPSEKFWNGLNIWICFIKKVLSVVTLTITSTLTVITKSAATFSTHIRIRRYWWFLGWLPENKSYQFADGTLNFARIGRQISWTLKRHLHIRCRHFLHFNLKNVNGIGVKFSSRKHCIANFQVMFFRTTKDFCKLSSLPHLSYVCVIAALKLWRNQRLSRDLWGRETMN